MVLLMPAWCQQMEVNGFKRLKGGLFGKNKVTKDKQLATLDLKTGEKGFTFLADGKQEVQAEEADGMVTVKVPNKTQFIVIKHGDYGQLTWKVPNGKLKKKKHYQANLLTFKQGKEFKPAKQWVVFHISPKNAIVTVDSVTTLVRNGKAQYYLPPGRHGWTVESPFHEAVDDSLTLTDSVRLVIPVNLQPVWSYITVRAPLEGGHLVVDGIRVSEPNLNAGTTSATSGRLQAGRHVVGIYRGTTCFYETEVMLGKAEKKVILVEREQISPRLPKIPKSVNPIEAAKADSLTADVPRKGDPTLPPPSKVIIEAPSDSTEILVNLEPVGRGRWEGELAQGFYALSTRKDGMTSKIQYLWVDDESPKTVKLMPPLADFGVLNIHSNVVGADIYINNVKMGQTPCAFERMPAGEKLTIRLKAENYHDAKQEVEVIANDMVDVDIKLKIKN